MPNQPTLYRIALDDIASDVAAAALRHAADVLRLGGLVAFPTETVYGLGANALDPAAVAKIFAAKGRPANNPLIVHVARLEQARQLAAEWPEAADRLATRFWPGPLTIVVPRAPHVPDIVAAGAATIAIRIPIHPVARALLDSVDLPIAAPSANRSNQVSPTTAAHVLRGLGDRLDVVIDGGPASGGLESTVIDLSTDPPRLLRPGLIRPSEMEPILGPIDRPDMSLSGPNVALPSPGAQPQHYAPRAAMECVAQGGRSRVEVLCREGLRVGWLEFGDNLIAVPRNVVVIAMPAKPSAYAAELYAALHEMDAAGVDRIVVDLPPDGESWHAVHDRLRRGSTKEA
jgi:L-threonylcarbamoyladenylate synthase